MGKSQWWLVLMMLMGVIALVGCETSSSRDEIVALKTSVARLESDNKNLATETQHVTAHELDPTMEEELLALANNRDAWFLTSVITTEALEGLYDSWSLICRNKTSLVDYKGVVYKSVRPMVLGMMKLELKDAQKAERFYKVESWSSPWAYVEQTWKLDDKIVLGPERQLFLIESGVWHYHDC